MLRGRYRSITLSSRTIINSIVMDTLAETGARLDRRSGGHRSGAGRILLKGARRNLRGGVLRPRLNGRSLRRSGEPMIRLRVARERSRSGERRGHRSKSRTPSRRAGPRSPLSRPASERRLSRNGETINRLINRNYRSKWSWLNRSTRKIN